MNFEQNIANLAATVEKMESSEISLEASLKHFESGIELTRALQLAISAAEQRVTLLLDSGENGGTPQKKALGSEGKIDQ